MQKKNHQAGFTLIELLVVSTIFVLLMAASSGLFINFMVSGAKTNINQKLKQEASDALTQIEFLIRNAERVTSGCSPDGTTGNELSIQSASTSDDMITTITIVDEKITSSSNEGNYFLNSGYSKPTKLSFTCYTIPEKKSQYVSFNFTLEKTGSNLSDTVNQTVYGGVLVRNSR